MRAPGAEAETWTKGAATAANEKGMAGMRTMRRKMATMVDMVSVKVCEGGGTLEEGG